MFALIKTFFQPNDGQLWLRDCPQTINTSEYGTVGAENLRTGRYSSPISFYFSEYFREPLWVTAVPGPKYCLIRLSGSLRLLSRAADRLGRALVLYLGPASVQWHRNFWTNRTYRSISSLYLSTCCFRVCYLYLYFGFTVTNELCALECQI